jgi:hypothetical protein
VDDDRGLEEGLCNSVKAVEHGGSLVEATEHVLFLNICERRQDLGS